MRKKIAVASMAVASLFFAPACADHSPTENAATEPQLDAGSLFSRPRAGAPLHTRDAEFARLAREIPGFGGMFYDESGRLIIYMARTPRAGMATAELASSLATGLRSLGIEAAAVQQVTVQQGKYDFAQLYEWHQSLTSVLALPGVVLTDIDESRNRLQIGLEQGTSATAVEQAIASLGIPVEAVSVFETSPITLLRGQGLTLRDRVRPVAGGLQIVRDIAPGIVGLCTLGFNIRMPTLAPSADFFFTNSHCTEEIGSVAGTPFYQSPSRHPHPFVPGLNIGTEVWDPPFFSEPPCSPGWHCRWSDAAIAHYQIPRPQVAFGRIMSPTPGTIFLPNPTSHLTIVGELPRPITGQTLYKVGSGTGLTGGPVVLTCVNLQYPIPGQFGLFCQDFVQGAAGGGDSGAPVFEPLDLTGHVNLAGLLWGASSIAGGSFVVSAMWNIRADIPGGWTTH